MTRLTQLALRHRFALLFLSLLAFLLLMALTELWRGAEAALTPASLLQTAAFCLLLAAAVGSMQAPQARLRSSLGLSLPAIALSVLSRLTGSSACEAGMYLFSAAFLVHVIAVILIMIFRTTTITLDTLCAALCVYLLLGVVWALAYSLAALLLPSPFVYTLTPHEPLAMRIGQGSPVAVFYFSFVTLATLGYGDIVPVAAVTRMLACLEAIVGQLYLAVLVARLVGVYSAPPRPPPEVPPHESQP
jgi:hypothetical protein